MTGSDGPSRTAAYSETSLSMGSWCICSIGMLVFNKLAITVFRLECTLVALQMAFSCLVLVLFAWKSIHIGSSWDVLRWSAVVPFFCGMLLTSVLALKHAPMTLVVVFRCLAPFVGLAIERFYPDPLKVSTGMLASLAFTVVGTAVYCSQLSSSQFTGIFWVVLNNFFAIGDRLLQRLMLAKDQRPVDISKTGVTLLNNLEGLVPVLACAWMTGEFSELPAAIAKLDIVGIIWVVASCFVGVGISYTGIWAQSLISATSFLVLVNANKFAIIGIEALVMGTKHLNAVQVVGAAITIVAAALYGVSRDRMEKDDKASEQSALLQKTNV